MDLGREQTLRRRKERLNFKIVNWGLVQTGRTSS